MADKSDKTEKPTAKRKREARQKGQIPRSAEIVAWSGVLLASYLLPGVVRTGIEQVGELIGLIPVVIEDPEPARDLQALGSGLSVLLAVCTVPFAVMFVLAIVGNVAQVGLVLSTKALAPKFARLNPIAGFKRMFSSKALWELVKNILKLTVIVVVAWPGVTGLVEDLMGGSSLSLRVIVPFVAETVLGIIRAVAIAALVLAGLDYVVQRRQVGKDMMMSKQEIKQELKNSEGDPMIKSRIRSMQIRMSRNRMIANVTEADAVVVNPIHYAVALRYVPGSGAPRVVAKGSGHTAERIKIVAEEAGVPIVEATLLARALYRAVEVDEEIPAPFYEGVARVLAFVHRLRRSPLGLARGVQSLPGVVPVPTAEEAGTPATRRAAARQAARVAQPA